MQDIILYHDPGAGGDFLTRSLLSTGNFYARCEFDATNQDGKVNAQRTKDEVHALFPDPEYHLGTNGWGKRKWTYWDEQQIKSLTDKHWVLNSMRSRQIKHLRNLGCDWPILRINYKKNLYWFIKKCVLKKAFKAPHWRGDTNDKMDVWMFDRGMLPLYYLKKHLKWPKNTGLLFRGQQKSIWKKYPPKWEIMVDEMLVKDFSKLADFNPQLWNKEHVNNWISAQEPMFTNRPKLPKKIEKLFGYNRCLEPTDWACPLDRFDNILIKFHYPDAPTFNNTQELFTYF